MDADSKNLFQEILNIIKSPNDYSLPSYLIDKIKDAVISPLPDKQGESGEQAITNELTKRHAEKSDYRDFRKLGYIAALIDVNNYIDMVESDPKIRVSAFALREFMKNKINEKSNSQSEAF